MKKAVIAKICMFCFFIIFALVNVNDKALAVSWGHDAMKFDSFLNQIPKENNEEIVIALLDTGIDTDHPWFKDRIKSGGANCFDAKCKSGGYEDDHGHGTFISGILVKETPKNVKILPIKVLDKNNSGWVVDFVAGVDYVVTLKKSGMNIAAINFSINSANQELGSKYSNMYKEAFDRAYSEGILTVVSAGNNKKEVKTIGPGNLENVITVSSLTKTPYNIQFSQMFSNYGNTIDFAAPGDNIYSAKKGGGTAYDYGTSFATPYVVSSIANLYTMCPNCSTGIIEKVLKNSTIDMGKTGKDEYYGQGMIDMKMAYTNILKEVKYKINLSYYGPTGSGYVYLDGGKSEYTRGETTTARIVLSNSKYEVTAILVDGRYLTKNEINNAIKYGYKFANINLNHRMVVTVSNKTYHIIATVVGNGKISPSTNFSIRADGSVVYHFMPDKKYKVSKIVIDGKVLSDSQRKKAYKSGYVFDKINADHTIRVEFKKQNILEQLFGIKW